MRLTEAARIMGGSVRAPSHPAVDGGRNDADPPLKELSYDSRRISPGTLFFCVPGSNYDGHDFAGQAAHHGAAGIVCRREMAVPVPQVVVEDVLDAMNRLASPFFGNPSRHLKVLGVSGTNGKTTIVYMLHSIFKADGNRTGLIGTVETKISDEASEPGTRTTPESTDLQRTLAKMVRSGTKVCAMEVTSIGLERGRVRGTSFETAIFTNLTQDHLDYHKDMESYFEAKSQLFTTGYTRKAAINADDEYGRRLLGKSEIRTLAFGMEDDPDLKGENVQLGRDGSAFRVRGPGIEMDVTTLLAGRFNVSNALGAAAGALLAGANPGAIVRGLGGLSGVPGRMEKVNAGQDFSVIVDYAHTPAALDAVMAAARELDRRGRLIVVFGCGGDRDRSKRPQMGRVAAGADIVILTSDNPRTEDPSEILVQIESGLKEMSPPEGYFVIEDRQAAIARAVGLAKPNDVVLIAGKGHETGQEVKGVKHPFDDRAVALEALKASLAK